jgi:ABC-type transport system involved in multi-copper enzyme maturation permease subunit
MLKTLILNDIRQNIMSLRLQVMLIIVLLVFIVGSIAFIYQYKADIDDYQIYSDKSKADLISQTGRNVSEVAVEKRDYIFKPGASAFIENAKSQYIPNTVAYNAYNVFGYSISRRTGNPYLYQSQELSWSFIVTIILSFAVLLLSFDAISGEKESHTLSLMVSNSVSRLVLIAAKYISIIITCFLVVLPGFIVSLLIVIASGIVKTDAVILFEVSLFIVAQLFIITCIAALGLFCSVVSRSSNVSLLLCLTLWLVFLIFSPNLAVFAAENVFKIIDSETVQSEIESAKEAINNAAPEGSWAMNYGNPFYSKHELRAKNQTNLMNAEKQISDEWYNAQFKQYQKATLLTYLSPLSVFGLISESITANGYLRFRKNWDDLHIYQVQFLRWFKSIDANDPESPHWYNPFEGCSTSRLPVKVEEIPQYTEKMISMQHRMTYAAPGLLLLITYSFILFSVTAVLFNRYDVR